MTGDDHQEQLDLGLPAEVVTAEAGAGPRDGLSWTWDLDIEALLAAVTGPAPWTRGPDTASGQPAAEALKADRDRAGHPAPAANAPEAAPHPAPAPLTQTPAADSPPSTPAPGPAPDPALASEHTDGPPPSRTPEPAHDPAPHAAAPDPAGGPVPPAADAASAAGPVDTGPELDPVEVEWAEYLEAVEAGRSEVMPLPVVAGRVAEMVPAGPELAGWLGAGQIGGLEDGALAGVAASCRRLASWAQAGELAAVAELASRSAAADTRIGVGDDGRPAKLPASACAEVSLALTMSQAAASWWADLAVTLRWRLAATGTALAEGTIDLARARAIADATAFLDDDTARAVQDRVLPKAGTQTTGQLRAALRRAVIAADPEGADRRREEAEKQAKVMLYPDAEGTASLGGYNLPGIPATAAMARITALARALQAAGSGGGIDRLRAHVLLGLLLGTLPYIPPAPDAPPDQPPPDDYDGQADDGPPGDEPSTDGPSGGGHPDGGLPHDGTAGGGSRGGRLPDDESPGGDLHDGKPPSGNLSPDRAQRGRAPADCPGRDDDRRHGTEGDRRKSDRTSRDGHGTQDAPPASQGRHPTSDAGQPGNQPNNTGHERATQPGTTGGQEHRPNHAGDQSEHNEQRPDPDNQAPDSDNQPSDPNGQRSVPDERPPSRDRPDDPHLIYDGPHPGYDSPQPGRASHSRRGEPADEDIGTDGVDGDDGQATSARPPPAWPEVPAFLQAGPAAMNHLTPASGAGGLLDLRLPWSTLTGESPQPGYLGRIGPITPAQARYLAGLAAADPGTRWRIILTDIRGQAIATTTLTRPPTSRHQQAGLIKQVTVTIGPDDLTHPQQDGLPAALRRILTVARHLAGHAARRAARDTQTDDGCAHDDATASYRPTTRLRDYITARDLTCRFPTCRQPVWRCDLDHTTPFDQGGRTCSCNLGGLCRFHHQVKGQVCWHLDQANGVFTWTTPTGRRYTVQPDAYAA